MNPECKEHEIAIVERIGKTVDDKVNISVTNRMLPISRWVTGSIIASLALLISIFIHNSNSMVRLETQYMSLKESIEEQNLTLKEYIAESKQSKVEQQKVNLSIYGLLNDTDKKLYYVGFGVKQINPDFQIDGLRGETIKD